MRQMSNKATVLIKVFFRSCKRDGARRAANFEYLTLKTSKRMIALAPSTKLCPLPSSSSPTKPSNPGWSTSTTPPLQKKRMILGAGPKLQNMIVTRPFSYTWEIVSAPDPVASMYATRFGDRTLNVLDGSPLGEMLMCDPARGADAVKKMG